MKRITSIPSIPKKPLARYLRALAALFFLTAVARAGTLTVNSLADNTIAGDGKVTLREAIFAAENNSTTDLGQTGTINDTIDLSGLSGTIQLTADLPTINSVVTFIGPGATQLTIDGGGSYGCLTLQASAVVSVSGLTIQHCFRAGHGAAVNNSGALEMTQCVLTANSVQIADNTDVSGSAIQSAAFSTTQLTDCTISSNVANALSSSGYFFVGSAVSVFGTLHASGCDFDRNSTSLSGAPTGGGGEGNTLSVDNAGSVSLTNCLLRGGFTTQPQGTGYFTGPPVYLGSHAVLNAQSCTFTGNTGMIADCIMIGAPTFEGATANLTNCTIAGNGNSSSGSLIATLPSNGCDCTLSHCTISGNVNNGASSIAISWQNTNGHGTLTIANSLIVDADKSSGAVEIGVGSSSAFTTLGKNFIASYTGAAPSSPVASYNTVAATTMQQIVSPIADNGGPLPTCSLPTGSPAIDAADPADTTSSDERGVTRPRDGDGVGGAFSDLGAYERFNGDLSIIKTVDHTQVGVGGTLVYTLTVTNDHPLEDAASVVVTDALPSFMHFVGSSNSTFDNVTQAHGVVTARRATLGAGLSASVKLTCALDTITLVNAATVSQLGFDINASDNTSTATAAVAGQGSLARVTHFAPRDSAVSSSSQVVFRIAFDRNVNDLSVANFSSAPRSPLATISQLTPVGSASVYDVTASGIAASGNLQLLLSGNEGPSTSTQCLVDRQAPVSSPVAAEGTLGPPGSTLFHIFFTATDNLSGVRGVQAFYRKGPSGPFASQSGPPIMTGWFGFDTAQFGGNGYYEFYIVATDNAGNVEDKPAQPQIGVTFGDAQAKSGVLGWQVFN